MKKVLNTNDVSFRRFQRLKSSSGLKSFLLMESVGLKSKHIQHCQNKFVPGSDSGQLGSWAVGQLGNCAVGQLDRRQIGSRCALCCGQAVSTGQR